MSLSILFSNQSGGTFDGRSLEEKIGATFAAEVQAIREGISNHVARQVPSFIEEEHPIFINFLEAYYEWLEQKVNVFGRTALMQDMGDIDKTLDEYVINFKRQFLLNFPEELATDTSGNVVDERTMLKNIKDFYQTKGSEKSYKLLFRLLYDSACELYYPKTDILKTSDGNWIEEEAIKVTSINGTKNFKMAKNKIEQIDKNTGKVNASARVFRVHQYSVQSHEVTELFINNIVGTFYPGSEIQCVVDDDTTLKENVYGLFSTIQIDEAGSGYKEGDVARENDNYRNIDALDGNAVPVGSGGSGRVSRVSLKGEIKNASVDNAGVNYTEPVQVVFEGGDGKGKGTMIPTALVKYAGYFKGNNGKLSSNKKIQDGHFYQNYSYVIKAEVSLDTYKEVLKNLIHPAGLRVFGNISLLKSLQSDMPFHGEHQSYEVPMVGHYAPYRFLSTTNLRDNGVSAGSSAGGKGWSGATANYGTSGPPHGQTFGDLYFLGYNPGSTQNYHCFGETGGKLIVRGPSLTAGSFVAGQYVSGDTSGSSGEVLSWSVFSGSGDTSGATTSNDVLGVLHLRRTRDHMPSGWCGPAGGEFGEHVIGNVNQNRPGTTAEILTILEGNGVVAESYEQPSSTGLTLTGLIAHDPRNLPLGTAGSTSGVTGDENGLTFEGADAALAATILRNLTGLTAYNFFEVHRHPNTRGLSGQYLAGGWTQGIDSGMSFDAITLKTFLRMPVGWHFHSNPSSDSLYYGGSSSDSIYYSVPYGSTMGSSNLTTI